MITSPKTPEELLESMQGMFLPPSAMGEVNALKVLCLQRENEKLRKKLLRAVDIAEIVGWTKQMEYLVELKEELDELKGEIK